MSSVKSSACSDLSSYATTFVKNGCNSTVATKLKNDKGVADTSSSSHTDCTDLNDINDCYIGNTESRIKDYTDCGWKKFFKDLFNKVYELNKSIVSSICGLWTSTHKIEDMLDGYTFRSAEFTASSSIFTSKPISGTDDSSAVCHAGTITKKFKVTNMTSVLFVQAQTRVVGARIFPSTVVVESFSYSSNYVTVKMIVYEWVTVYYSGREVGEYGILVPYDLPIDIMIVGKNE